LGERINIKATTMRLNVTSSFSRKQLTQFQINKVWLYNLQHLNMTWLGLCFICINACRWLHFIYILYGVLYIIEYQEWAKIFNFTEWVNCSDTVSKPYISLRSWYFTITTARNINNIVLVITLTKSFYCIYNEKKAILHGAKYM
jgi:hypothetical protein